MSANAVSDEQQTQWIEVCDKNALDSDTGVCALINGKQIAVFYVGKLDEVFAIDNYDPIGKANVLSRGIIGTQGEHICVASPLYKEHYDLRTGECLENSDIRVTAYAVKIENGKVLIAV
ncbi:nitrite reductase small subunit NirD [Gilvimarinus xylanilyticus]|uniref:Nitrite reductase small subunit NirD n=1 Tax=Gilvimarinus xylanilyticus TaxID=2944139 RepID=A0A9X2I1H6_9GAMM|nr:nitrite reductase small subunit NirD [Gilvimarinus xylanilyticus]MCP8900391.1 nitrite reductase small subunit NirD [Gilvimarinus xylanilyticus]